MITPGLLLTLICVAITNFSLTLQSTVMTSIPEPMEAMFNESFYLHYGSYLEIFGLSSIWSIGTILFTLGHMATFIFIVPLLNSKGNKFVAVHLKFVIIAVLAILLISAYLIPSFEIYLLACICFGSCTFFTFAATTLYLTELTPKSQRGVIAVCVAFGQTAGHIICLNLDRPAIFGSIHNWIFLPISAISVAILPTIFLCFAPQSPLSLCRKKQYNEMQKSLAFYQGKNAMIPILSKNKSKISIKEVWKNPWLRKMFCIYVFLSMYVEVSPSQVDALFFTRFHEILGFQPDFIMSIGSIQRMVFLPLYLLSSYFIDRIGRRNMILIGGLIVYLKAIVSGLGLLLSFISGPNILTQILAVSNDVFSGIFTSLSVTTIQHLIIYELVNETQRSTIIKYGGLLSMSLSLAFTAVIPYAFSYFPPLPYAFLLILHLFTTIYLWRELPSDDFLKKEKEDFADSFEFLDETSPLL